MSYRGFKRLLGETSLERKSRWLLGTIVLCLMFASFFFYARQTEEIAYDQLTHTGRTLVTPILVRAHVRQKPELDKAIEEFQKSSEDSWPENLKRYQYQLIIPGSTRPDRAPSAEQQSIIKLFQDEPTRIETSQPRSGEKAFLYYGAVRAGKSCVACHRDPEEMAKFADDTPEAQKAAAALARIDLAEGDLMAVVKVQLSTEMIESGFHQNRALLIAIAVTTTLLILAGIYLVIRYIVVRPVKHLKAVADAISAGQLTIRSDIQTGDEFEDLSVAFNRMLTNLTQMQERNRTLIEGMDDKVNELARANMALYESNRMKADFLSTMSHELRTPLNSVIGFSENLLNAENLTEKQHRWAANILTSGQQLLALINDILDLAKMEAGKSKIKAEVLIVTALCDAALAQIRPQADKKEIELRVQYGETWPTIRQDEGKIRQILSNLLSNAVKFTPDGGMISLSANADEKTLTIIVQDTGIGIPPEEQELIFQKFRQASNPLTREQGGTGLGLSIVRELARLLGGDVAVRSELGRGSTFTVTLASQLKEDPMAAYSSEVRSADFGMRN